MRRLELFWMCCICVFFFFFLDGSECTHIGGHLHLGCLPVIPFLLSHVIIEVITVHLSHLNNLGMLKDAQLSSLLLLGWLPPPSLKSLQLLCLILLLQQSLQHIYLMQHYHDLLSMRMVKFLQLHFKCCARWAVDHKEASPRNKQQIISESAQGTSCIPYWHSASKCMPSINTFSCTWYPHSLFECLFQYAVEYKQTIWHCRFAFEFRNTVWYCICLAFSWYLEQSRTVPSKDALWIHLRIPGSLGPHHILLCGRDTSIVVFRLAIVYSSLSFDDPGDRSTGAQKYRWLLLPQHPPLEASLSTTLR